MSKLNVENILKHNPSVDLDLLNESTRIKEELERLGHKKPGYQLARRKIEVVDDYEIAADRKTVQLAREKRNSAICRSTSRKAEAIAKQCPAPLYACMNSGVFAPVL